MRYAMRYEHYKKAWHNIKPIRGRGIDVRPIGKRRRDWEQIVRVVGADGVESYGAKLHNTVCVEYFPDESIVVRHESWNTPSTAEFINDHSPFRCWKQNNRLWVRQTNNDLTIPIPDTGLRFVRNDQGDYVCSDVPTIKKSVIDRAKAKEARVPLQPFLNFARAFLSLSDGWVMHETCKQVLGWDAVRATDGHQGYATHYMADQELFGLVYDNGCEENYLKALCVISRMKRSTSAPREDLRMAEMFTKEHSYEYGGTVRRWMGENKFYDVRLHYADLKQLTYKWVDMFMDVRKQIDVQPGSKAVGGILDIVK